MLLNYQIVGLIVVLLAISFISGVRSAYFSASRIAMELKRKQGKYSGRVWSAYFHYPTRFVSTSLLAFNFFLVALCLFWWNVLGELWAYWSVDNVYSRLAGTILVATCSLLIVEFLFRSVFHSRPTAILGSGFVTFLTTSIFYFFERMALYFVNISEWILKYILNINFNTKSEAFTKPDIDVFIQRISNANDIDDLVMNNDIFENILALPDVKLRTCLIPRREVIGVKEGVSLDELMRVFSETKLTRLIVYEDTIDNIKGYVHQLDLFKEPHDLHEILMPIPVVPENMSVMDLIRKFSTEGKSIAWVIDEFGGTAGIITMEDLLEEIFGEINDEFDSGKDFMVEKIATDEFLLSGRLPLHEIEEQYKLTFQKSEDVETLSGYIIKRNGRIPRQRDRIIIDDYQFDIVSVTKTRIDAVRLKILR